MADAIAIVVLADVVSWICGRCYFHLSRWKATVAGVMTTFIEWMTDVIAIVADGIATGWNVLIMADVAIVADGLTTWGQ